MLECQGRAQQVLVARAANHHPIGFISCHLLPASSQGHIGLVGVSSEASGKGIGRALVLAALEWFAVHHANEVKVVTQASNISAQRLYQRCGFLSAEVQIWYHKWYADNARCETGRLLSSSGDSCAGTGHP
jgi:ribosomal protein S18 acetylase RimI-like enzyme